MSVKLITTITEMRRHIAEVRPSRTTIGVVPTMGALHAGHTALIDRAVEECGHVIVTLFVNPTQFNQTGDYERYPRTMDHDREVCEQRRADALFAPSLEEMYPGEQRAFVEVTHLTEHLCGKFRPGHFRGVATVVMKLFNIVQADRAYFGEKDAQQLAVIQRMVEDLNVPTTIVAVPIVREDDGLAISSRNQYLSADERRAATVLYESLKVAERIITEGARKSDEIKEEARAAFNAHPKVRVEYLEIVDPDDMQPVQEISGPVRVTGAIWVGSTRLIDNLLCLPVREEARS